MAYQIKKIDPLDLQPRKAIGVSLPFSGKAVFNSTYQSRDAIKTNLINYFLTRKRERYLNPLFGNKLPALLFDQYTEDKLDEIESQIREDISIYFPKVKVERIEITEEPDNNLVLFSMKYNIENTNVEDEIAINFEQ